MVAQKISGLSMGTPKLTDLFVAVDTTDSSMAPTGTDKKYLNSDLSTFFLNSVPVTVTKYVSSTGGTDAVTSGTVLKPYATLAYAYSQITDASASKIYVIRMAGNFSETTIQVKPWIMVDGQNSILNITNQVVAHSTLASGGGVVVIENFSNINVAAGFSIDVSAAPSATIKLNNLLSNSVDVTWQIIGNPSGTIVAQITDCFQTGLNPSISIKDCFGRIDSTASHNLSLLSSSSESFDFSLFDVSVTTGLNAEALAGLDASMFTVYANGCTVLGGLTVKSNTGSHVTFIQSAIKNISSVTLDGTGLMYNTDSQSTSITLLNGATILSNVSYRSLSDGISANYIPVNYTPTNLQIKGHLQGIDAVLGGTGTTFLEAANNLSDVASVATSRTNLGLGTIALQNANAVSITGGSITNTNLNINTGIDTILFQNGGFFLKFNPTDNFLINGVIATGSIWTGGTIGGAQIDGTPIGITTPAAAKFTSITESAFGTAGVVHNDASGLFSSSLIVNADITASTIANSKLGTMAAHTFKGNNTGSAANPLDLTISQMQSELGIPGTLGTMSLQNANAVNITGGTITNTNLNINTAVDTILFQSGPFFLKFNPTDNFLVNGVIATGSIWTGGSIGGAQIDGSPTGITTPAAGKFTTLQATTGLTLPTSGGAPSSLNYYENFVLTTNLSGPWASSHPITMRFIRTGEGIIIKWNTVSAAITVPSAQINSLSGVVPTQFRPADDLSFEIPVINGLSSTTYAHGNILISTAGKITITGENNGVFGATGSAGFFACGTSYTIG